MAQTAVIFALVSVIWIVYGYSLAFSEGNDFIGGFSQIMLKNITVDSLSGPILNLFTLYSKVHLHA